MYIDKAIEEMKVVFKDLPWAVEHTLHVLGFAQTIADSEGLTGDLRETTALAAVLHDIGFVEAERKHGSLAGPFQELEGPPVAQGILTRIGTPEETMERVCYIVGHHHTASAIDGIDFQILWEADCIENTLDRLKEHDAAALGRIVGKNFKTSAGRRLASERFGLKD
jgi:HD superfamily phosphodiesterase